jgi:hypothetical protein
MTKVRKADNPSGTAIAICEVTYKEVATRVSHGANFALGAHTDRAIPGNGFPGLSIQLSLSLPPPPSSISIDDSSDGTVIVRLFILCTA